MDAVKVFLLSVSVINLVLDIIIIKAFYWQSISRTEKNSLKKQFKKQNHGDEHQTNDSSAEYNCH